MNGPQTVHVIDDNALSLRATARLLRASGHTVKTFDSAEEFLAKIAPEAAGCVVTDLDMPGIFGLELQAILKTSGRAMPVVFLTGRGNIPSSVRAMREGAEDFLEKRASKDNLLGAINRALRRDTEEREAGEELGQRRARFDVLTSREREVLGHVIRGQLNKEIAAALGLHERTVKLHRTAIKAKLGVTSVAELMRMVQEAGWQVSESLRQP
jgi:FixJ family two-component response regulator